MSSCSSRAGRSRAAGATKYRSRWMWGNRSRLTVGWANRRARCPPPRTGRLPHSSFAWLRVDRKGKDLPGLRPACSRRRRQTYKDPLIRYRYREASFFDRAPGAKTARPLASSKWAQSFFQTSAASFQCSDCSVSLAAPDALRRVRAGHNCGRRCTSVANLGQRTPRTLPDPAGNSRAPRRTNARPRLIPLAIGWWDRRPRRSPPAGWSKAWGT